jgi:hypothetical protein
MSVCSGHDCGRGPAETPDARFVVDGVIIPGNCIGFDDPFLHAPRIKEWWRQPKPRHGEEFFFFFSLFLDASTARLADLAIR